MYPDPPADAQSLDIQQQALLREQQRKIRLMKREEDCGQWAQQTNFSPPTVVLFNSLLCFTADLLEQHLSSYHPVSTRHQDILHYFSLLTGTCLIDWSLFLLFRGTNLDTSSTETPTCHLRLLLLVSLDKHGLFVKTAPVPLLLLLSSTKESVWDTICFGSRFLFCKASGILSERWHGLGGQLHTPS